MSTFFNGKTILVTGATGSIGSEIVRQLIQRKPKTVRIFSRDEHKQFLMREKIGDPDEIRYFLGDVRDPARLLRAMEGVDYVFHCAAYKHVPFCEYNSFEAVKTNVIGTENVIEAAHQQGVKRVLFVSTDKAASPSNVMGATKLLAERLMISAMYSRGQHDIIFSSVRFGNVLGSRGSMIPLFCRQIRDNEPVTVTDPEMTRFIMSIPEAVHLTFSAMELMQGGELFILKMPVVKLHDLVEVLVEEVAPLYGKDPSTVRRRIIGIRPGEKMQEILMTSEEAQYAMEGNKMFVVRSALDPFTQKDAPVERHAFEAYTSVNASTMDRESIRELVKKYIATTPLAGLTAGAAEEEDISVREFVER
jgi:UDP-N-acetylglucosamine 4,6-dehydratase/5-epimerase